MVDYINPTQESGEKFNSLDRKGPVQMLNLIKLRVTAAYEDGRDVSGAEAYQIYGRESGPIFKGVGGRIIWSGRPEVMVIGPEEGEDWDIAFIAEYPDMAALAVMIRNPDYQAITFHRTAAVKNSRLIRMMGLAVGSEFGGG